MSWNILSTHCCCGHGRTTQDLRCSLERLAKDVFDFHTKGCHFDPQRSCAEWWVQVRGGDKTAGKKKGRAATADDDGRVFKAPTGIGFHWDKDEDLVDQTGVTVCPQISTVTYLTVSSQRITNVLRGLPRASEGVRTDLPIDELPLMLPVNA